MLHTSEELTVTLKNMWFLMSLGKDFQSVNEQSKIFAWRNSVRRSYVEVKEQYGGIVSEGLCI
jgi:hypothetical protein